MLENEARKDFLKCIEEFPENEDGFELGLHYSFFQKLVKILKTEYRWKKYAMKNRSVQGGGEGQEMPETLLDHMLHKFMVASEMVAIEKGYGGHKSLEIRRRQLYLSFFMYSLAMAAHGEISLMDKNAYDLAQEDNTFMNFLRKYPEVAHGPFRRAYELSQERDRAILAGKNLDSISVTGRFLWAIVVATFLDKSLYEVRRGQLAFANTFHNVWEDIEPLMREFYSFRIKVSPILSEIKGYMDSYPRWAE
ncbi:MAG: hypothetical protein COU51_04830 [Parcubacteria group bacterium CG10_big_fil_rev_8_21_14_0_10_36_14]|nr:MAG: hypothetical protein COU51_04830 [Parcubacteria group bacterium CG10_big_fil_rev_8_21_14_0_10_36_14]